METIVRDFLAISSPDRSHLHQDVKNISDINKSKKLDYSIDPVTTERRLPYRE